MIGTKFFFPALWAGGGGTGPVLSSLNYDLADIEGGDSITITGLRLDGATSCTVGGTSATITANTSTSLTFTMPAKTAGTYDVLVTNMGGVSNALSIEAWAPLSESSCTFLAEKGDYNGGTGTWTTRLGTNLADAGVPPNGGAGYPAFEGIDTQWLDGDTMTNYLPTTGGTMALVATSGNIDAINTGTPYTAPSAIINETNGTLGLAYGDVSGTKGWMAHVYDGTAYRTLHVAASLFDQHTVVTRYDSSSLETAIDGGSFNVASPAPTGLWGFSGGNLRIGATYNGIESFNGTIKAVALFDVKISNAVATKLWKWSQVHLGATPPVEYAGAWPVLDWNMDDAVVTSGSDIDSVPDASGNGNTLTGVTSNKPTRVTADSDFNGRDSADFPDDTTKRFSFAAISPAVQTNGPFFFLIVAKVVTSEDRNQYAMSWTDDDAAIYGTNVANGNFWACWVNSGISGVVSNDLKTTDATIAAELSGGTQNMYVDSSTAEGSAASAGAVFTGGGVLGNYAAGVSTAFGLAGKIARVMAFRGRLPNATQRAEIVDEIVSAYGT